MLPIAYFFISLSNMSYALQQDGNVLRRTNVLYRHGQKLGGRITILADCSLVHGEKTQRLAVIRPGGMRVVVEKQAVAFFALMQPFFSALTLSNVPCNLGKSSKSAIFIFQRSDHYICPKLRPVFAHQPAFFFATPCQGCHLELTLGKAAS